MHQPQIPYAKPPGQLIKHPSGFTSHVLIDGFTDPWDDQTETILIQHGFARNCMFFYHWVPALARNYRVVRRDLRGHGWSTFDSDPQEACDSALTCTPWTVQSICEDIVDTLDRLGIKKVHFVGESTSGMLGEILATQHTDRLLSLTVCSSPTHLPEAAKQLFAFGHEDWPTACRKLGSRGWGEALSSISGSVGADERNNKYRDWWLTCLSISSAEGLARYAEFLSNLDSRSHLNRINVPTLILAPTNSVATSREEQEGIHRSIPGSRLVFVDGIGHEIYVDKADECLSAMTSFLTSLGRESDDSSRDCR